jgi:hypothetical protein
MKISYIIAALVCALTTPAFAKVTIFNFSGVIEFEDFNGDDTPGLGLAPIQTGDVVRGFFDFDDSVVGQIVPGTSTRPSIAFFLNPTRRSQIQIIRNGVLIFDIKLRPIIFGNGNPSDLSQINVSDRDPFLRRDILDLRLEGGDPASGTALGFTPQIPGLEGAAFNLTFREQCATGSVEAGNCVSNNPDFDFFNGSNPRVDFLRAFNDGGVRELSFFFSYRNGDTAGAFGTFNSFAAIPEPESWAMMITGFALVGFASRRRWSRSVIKHEKHQA